MSTPRIQMSFRVDEALYKTIQTEATARNLSVQEMIIAALTMYFENQPKGELKTQPPQVSASRQAEVTLWEKYLERMPEEKIEIATSAMRWDLQMQSSARRKEPKWKAQPSSASVRRVRVVGERRTVEPENK